MVQHEPLASDRPRTDPVRTCIGCRRRELAAELLRIVASNPGPRTFTIVPDPGRRLPGRGAWLHPTAECLNLAVRRRAFGRALKVSGTPDAAALDQLVGSEEENRRGLHDEVATGDTNSDIEL